MNRTVSLLLVTLLLFPAWAEESTEQAADRVLAAIAANDREALQDLAAADDPDPWLVADDLCYRGKHDAAEAFARAAPRKSVEKLPAYVASHRAETSPSRALEILPPMFAAYRAGDLGQVIERAEASSLPEGTVGRVLFGHLHGFALRGAGRLEEGAQILLETGRSATHMGWLSRADTLLRESGRAAARHADWRGAATAWKARLEVVEALGEPELIAETLGSLGEAYGSLGDYPSALSCVKRSLAIYEDLGDRTGAAVQLGNLGVVYQSLGDFTQALECHERALRLKKEVDDRPGAAATLGNIGTVHGLLGNFPKALAFLKRALAAFESLEDRAGVAWALRNIGSTHTELGDYPKALSILERTLQEQEALGDRREMVATLVALGNTHFEIGDYRAASSHWERALTLSRDVGDRAAESVALGNVGLVHLRLGDLPKALSFQEQAFELKEALGYRQSAAMTLTNIGNLLHDLGDYPKALAVHERALASKEHLGDRAGVVASLGSIGMLYAALGDRAKAITSLEQALRLARRLRATPLVLRTLRQLAQVHLDGGDFARALLTAQRGLEAVESLLGGLGEEEGATARTRHASLFQIGALAAARLGDAAEVVTFLESGRSGALLESLGAGRAVRFASLPPELLRAEADARASEARAHQSYDLALQAGDLKEARRAARTLDESRERVREVAARIQREAKRVAGLFYPRAATIEELQDWLEADQALVLYGLCRAEALALVLTNEEARIVFLGTAAGVDPTADPAELAKLLVAPLTLGDAVKTVIVSPDGALCYVPFGALFDRPVALTPSGTTHVLLREEEREAGRGVLALGDPDYEGLSAGSRALYFRGRPLIRLAASRVEAEAVGTVRLLGADATEASFAATVGARERWRAVHFACHGLIDPERPTLSALALSAADGADGFLTALEVLRMEIPADLAVLSGCETAKGKVVKGEGIVGLTRAFMYAGSPRVICSLWKVDDEATRALMVKFYELWNPKDGSKGLGAAAALKKAQEYVRGHEEWKHPYYWAAWVLWGLPS